MKKIFLSIIVFLFITIGLTAQYTTFPTGKAIWRAEETNVVLLRTTSSTYPNASSRQDIRFYYQGGDTLIGTKIYKKNI